MPYWTSTMFLHHSFFITWSLLSLTLSKRRVVRLGEWQIFFTELKHRDVENYICTLFHTFDKGPFGGVNFNLSTNRVKFKINAASFPIYFGSGRFPILISHPSISDNIFVWPFLTIWPWQTVSLITSFKFSIIRNWTKCMFIGINTMNWLSRRLTKTKLSWIWTCSLN